MEQPQLNSPLRVAFFTSSIEEVQHIYLIVETEQTHRNSFKNQILTESDGTLRCLTIPNIYYGLDDVDEAHNVICEPCIHIHLLSND